MEVHEYGLMDIFMVLLSCVRITCYHMHGCAGGDVYFPASSPWVNPLHRE